jgi:hypothetical protein
MRILTAFTALAIVALTAGAGGTSLALAPAATPTAADVTLSAFVSPAGPVMTHKCADCGGTDACKHCIGTGASGNAIYSKKSCSSCGGTGTCQSCIEPEPLQIVPNGD